MLSLLRGAVFTIALFYISVLYKSRSFLYFGYACASLIVLACLFLIYRMRTLRCSLLFPIAIAECGKPLTLRISLENSGAIPCLKLGFLLELNNLFLKDTKKEWLKGGMAVSGSNRFDYVFTLENYGSYEVRLKKVRIYDLTGLFYVHKKVTCSGNVQVLPKMQEIGIQITEAAKNFFGDAQVYDELRPGTDRTELFQIREFRKGDKIQSIHWKLSAKQNELLVKEDSLPRACPAVLFLDYKKKRQKKAERVNAYLTIFASISFSLMDAGCAHYAAWYSGRREDIVRVRVEDEESLYVFLSGYLEETFQEKERDLEQAYKEKYVGENYLVALQLDERLKLLKNGERILKFSTENWKKELAGLEIIV